MGSRVYDKRLNRSFFTFFSEFNFPVSEGQLAAEGIYLSLVMVLGFVGNIWVVYETWRMKKLSSTYGIVFANKAACDLLLLLGVPFKVTARVTGGWHLGSGLCSVIANMDYLSLVMTSLSMTVVALDRYWYIVHSSCSADNPIFKHIRKVMATLWTVSIASCIPLLFYWKQMSVFDGTNTYVFCGVFWAPTVNNRTYSTVSGVLFLGIPFTIITICYTRIFLTVRTASHRISPNVLHGSDQRHYSHSPPEKRDPSAVFFTRRSGLVLDHAPTTDTRARWGCLSRDVAAGSGGGHGSQTCRPDNVPAPHGMCSSVALNKLPRVCEAPGLDLVPLGGSVVEAKNERLTQKQETTQSITIRQLQLRFQDSEQHKTSGVCRVRSPLSVSASRQTLLAHTQQRRLLTLLLTSVVLFVLMLMPQCIVGALTISAPVTSTHYVIATACTVTNTCVIPSLLLCFHRDYRMAATRRLHVLCPCCSRVGRCW